MRSLNGWYGGMFDRSIGKVKEPSGVVQIEDRIRAALRSGQSFRLPEHVLRLAQREYDTQHPGQPYERMQERCGLGLLEVVGLLADLAERHGAEPSPPGHRHGDRWCNNQGCLESGRSEP